MIGRGRRGCGGSLLMAAFLLKGSAGAQQAPEAMGTVAVPDAKVTGGLQVQGSTIQLLTNVGVTAHDHAAPITLVRGGSVLVCSTSEFHMLRSGSSGALVFGLDRGAVEVQTESRPQDAVLTPDLKLVPVSKGALNLKLRVTREGDTCIDNAGASAPVLNVTDPFSSASYRILPGQHVLFVGGDLHKVVDHERNPCGCPPTVAPRVLAGKPGEPQTSTQAAAAHPFPEAQSAGLAPTAEASNAAPVGTASSQVSTTFSYEDGQAKPTVAGASAAAPAGPVAGGTATSAAKGGFGDKLRRFFYRLFHPGRREAVSGQ